MYSCTMPDPRGGGGGLGDMCPPHEEDASVGCFVVAWGVLGSFKGPHDGYANRSNSQTSLPRPTDFTDILLRAVGQPTIFGTPLVVRQRIKYSLGRA